MQEARMATLSAFRAAHGTVDDQSVKDLADALARHHVGERQALAVLAPLGALPSDTRDRLPGLARVHAVRAGLECTFAGWTWDGVALHCSAKDGRQLCTSLDVDDAQEALGPWCGSLNVFAATWHGRAERDDVLDALWEIVVTAERVPRVERARQLADAARVLGLKARFRQRPEAVATALLSARYA